MLNTPITVIPGFGVKKAEKLAKIGIRTFEDVLYDFPARYVDRRKVVPVSSVMHEQYAVIAGKVQQIKQTYFSKIKKDVLILKVSDHFSEGDILFFSPQYIKPFFNIGQTYYFYGKIEKNGIFFKMNQPEFDLAEHQSFLKIVPIYGLTFGITQKEMGKLHEEVLERVLPTIKETLPETLLSQFNLCALKEALKHIHMPLDQAAYQRARKRIVFEELFELQMRLILLKHTNTNQMAKPYEIPELFYQWIDALPYCLTEAQERVLNEIIGELKGGKTMNRLIQGDVGSGKTILAFSALYLASLNGKQGALMVPTSLLAEQHYEHFLQLFENRMSVALLTSQTKSSEKKRIKEAVRSGEVKVLIGTHALIQEDVVFDALGLIVTDEQHRFGIKQRLTAVQKGEKPHALIMSATPIPRTLSLILYGDMSVSTIDALPSGRKPIKTHFVKPDKVDEMYQFIEKQMQTGRQAYVVCPLVEDSETLDLNSAVAYYERLKTLFKAFNVGLVHGKMSGQEKDQVMTAFKENRVHLLVSTTVIEVGINVPNATLMVVLNAERFGLAQLHQLRGRVGRGAEQSYCFLLSDKLSKTSKERIQTLVNSNDGFLIAEKDLEMRGPGEVFGLRQHGLPELKLANLIADKKILEMAQECVKIVIAESKMGNVVLNQRVQELKNKNERGFTL